MVYGYYGLTHEGFKIPLTVSKKDPDVVVEKLANRCQKYGYVELICSKRVRVGYFFEDVETTTIWRAQ